MNPLAGELGKTKAAKLANDPALFVAAFDREPWPYQADILRAIVEQDEAGKFTRRYAVVSLPRQNGKSSISAWIGLFLLFTRGEQTIVTVANDSEQAQTIFRDAKAIIGRSGILYGLVERYTYSEVELKNGSRWLVKSAESVSSRGLRPSVVLYDELGWSRDRELFDVLSAAQAAQADPLTVVTSTVGPVQAGILWELFELARAGDPAVRLIYHKENLSPLVTDEFLQQQRAILPANVYAREHDNTWGAGSEAFCTVEDWQRAIGDDDPRLAEDSGPCVAYLDLGWVHDETALAVGKREDGRVRIVHLETWQGSQSSPVDFASVEARILELRDRLHITGLTIESPQGVAMAQRLDTVGLRAETYHPTAKGQRELWGGLYTALKQGNVWLPNDAKLRRQLLTLTIKATATGWKVVDDPSVHQDRAIAVAGVVGLCHERPAPAGTTVDVDAMDYMPDKVRARRSPRLFAHTPGERKRERMLEDLRREVERVSGRW